MEPYVEIGLRTKKVWVYILFSFYLYITGSAINFPLLHTSAWKVKQQGVDGPFHRQENSFHENVTEMHRWKSVIANLPQGDFYLILCPMA